MKSIKFSTACYILSFVAYHEDERLSTPTIARWVNTNPSRVRQIVATLVKAGLLVSRRGGQGGVVLGRPPQHISLRDIFDAVEDEKLPLFAVDDPFSDWKDICFVHDTLSRLRVSLDHKLRQELALIPLSSLYAPRPAAAPHVGRVLQAALG